MSPRLPLQKRLRRLLRRRLLHLLRMLQLARLLQPLPRHCYLQQRQMQLQLPKQPLLQPKNPL